MPAETSILSPDGHIVFEAIVNGPRLMCAVSFRGKPVIEASPMAMTVDGAAITEDVQAGAVERYQIDETYPWRGVHAQAVNRCNGVKIALTSAATSAAYTLEVRVFDDAAAFRIIVPGGEAPRAPDESTTFILPSGSAVWYHDLRGHYEGAHARKDIAETRDGDWAAPPLTFKLPGGAGFASITEAALANYAGMALQADGRRGFAVRLGHTHPPSYPFTLRYGAEEAERLSKPAAVAGTITTPWRVVMIGADLNALINCDAIHNLCLPADPALFPDGLATDWIKPGRAVWKYLDGGEKTLAEMKEFSRLAGELGFEHHVVEGFWRDWSEGDLRELVDYSRQRNVGVWLWKHRKSLGTPEERREFFGKCRDVGATGAKIDFFDHEAKEVIDLYQILLREAAQHKLLVNFHGANKPTGETRTWPNEITREGVKGMESSKLLARAVHDVTLPFTRMLAGPADYTPVHFGPRRADTTWAHQAASAAIFLSPLLTYAAHPKRILENPCVEIIKSIPATWDETVVLPPSEIGEVAAYARRSGATWFLAIMNGPTARTLTIPLSFLPQGGYGAILVRDRKDDPAAVAIETGAARPTDTITVEMLAGGGFIARFLKR